MTVVYDIVFMRKQLIDSEDLFTVDSVLHKFVDSRGDKLGTSATRIN